MWEIFLLLNELLWPVYVSMIALWLVSIIIINLVEWRQTRKNNQRKVQ